MAELKTQPNTRSVRAFLAGVEDAQRRKDCRAILGMMREATGEPPRMWGESIVGFGSYHYKYASGREGDWFVTGFSPRKSSLSLYLMCDLSRVETLLPKLGKHKRGKGCLYIKRLSEVDAGVLRELVEHSVQAAKAC